MRDWWRRGLVLLQQELTLLGNLLLAFKLVLELQQTIFFLLSSLQDLRFQESHALLLTLFLLQSKLFFLTTQLLGLLLPTELLCLGTALALCLEEDQVAAAGDETAEVLLDDDGGCGEVAVESLDESALGGVLEEDLGAAESEAGGRDGGCGEEAGGGVGGREGGGGGGAAGVAPEEERVREAVGEAGPADGNDGEEADVVNLPQELCLVEEVRLLEGVGLEGPHEPWSGGLQLSQEPLQRRPELFRQCGLGFTA